MTTFTFKDYGNQLGTRVLGAKVREDLLSVMERDSKVVLDFSGVDVVANAFADECIAKLLLIMSLSELKDRTTFAGLNDMAKMNIALALKRRQLALAANEFDIGLQTNFSPNPKEHQKEKLKL